MSKWLPEDEDVLQHFFGASLDMLCIAGFDGYFKKLNQAWTLTLGFTEEELQARPYLEFVHPDDRKATIAEAAKCTQGLSVVWFENRFTCRNGSCRWLLWHAATDMERGLIYAVARDVTQQKKLEEELQLASSWQRAILDGANFTIISTRPDGIIQTMNAGALRELGYAAEELIGKETPAILHDREEVAARARQLSEELGKPVEPGFETFVAKARLGQPDEHEWTYIRKNGSRFPILLSITAMRDPGGDIVGFLVIGSNLIERKRAEAARRSSEQQMQAIIDNTSAVIFMKGIDGRYLLVNRQYEELFHISRATMVGKRDEDVFSPEFARAFGENDRKAIEAGAPLQFEEVAPHDDGLHSYVSVKFPLYDEEGGISAVCGIAMDITARKRVEEAVRESESRLRAIMDNAVEGIIAMGEDQVIQSFNAAAVQIFGYEPAAVIGQNVRMLMWTPSHAEHGGNVPPNLETSEKRIIGQRIEVQGRHKDGTIFPIELSISETEVGGARLFTGMVHDITLRKQAEEDLLHSNESLEQFASVASHDLQEPLRMVSSYLQLLERHHAANLDDEAREYIGFAVAGAARMRHLVDDLLEYSRVGTRGKPLTFTGSADVLRIVCENLKPAIDEANATVTWDEDLPPVLADDSQLAQVFQNLIANAIKFHGFEAPRIHISARREDGRWTFAVSDNGIGIEEKYFERIFVIFQCLHAREKYEGTGIGLAVCKRIVERHEGRLWVESQFGHGATFFFTLEGGDYPQTKGRRDLGRSRKKRGARPPKSEK